MAEPEYFAYNHEKLFVWGAQGKSERLLSEIEGLCNQEKIEFSPVKMQDNPKREFLAAFNISPVVDITLVRQPNNDLSIVTYSLNNSFSKGVIDRIVQKSGIQLGGLEKSFKDTLWAEFHIEVKTYELAQGIAICLKKDLEKAWGAMRYMNHMQQYRGLSEGGSVEIAAKKFDFPELRNIFKRS